MVTANNVNPTGFAVAAYRSTVASLAADGSLVINIPGDPLIGEITFVPGSDLTNADITIQRFTADQPPADVGDLPSGVTVAGFIQITVSTGGTNHEVTIALTIPEADAGDPDKAVLIKWDGAGDEWTPHGRIALTLDGGVYSGTGTAPCCSFYAVAFDEGDPTVTLDAPDGELSGTVQLTATADDNLGVQRVEFWAGDTMLGEDTSEPWSLDVDTTALANGDHTFRAVAYDHVDNTAESSQDVTVQNDETTGPDGTDGKDGAPGDGDGGFNFGVLLLVLIVLAVIGFAGYYFYKQQGQK
ncbi:MAG: hypothetical protein KY455_12305 [Euryarchaeota archaeon]|nr:hypothetical protein [Euryarchaeota archaeon]